MYSSTTSTIPYYYTMYQLPAYDQNNYTHTHIYIFIHIQYIYIHKHTHAIYTYNIHTYNMNIYGYLVRVISDYLKA